MKKERKETTKMRKLKSIDHDHVCDVIKEVIEEEASIFHHQYSQASLSKYERVGKFKDIISEKSANKIRDELPDASEALVDNLVVCIMNKNMYIIPDSHHDQIIIRYS